MAEIEIEDLYKEYGTGQSAEVAVNGIDIEIGDGEFFTFVGPSGCGKTTTLRCVAGLETPTNGRILINDEDVTHKPPQQRQLSMVFQDIALYPHMSVEKNISYPLDLIDAPQDKIDEEIDRVTEILQINELLEKNPGELSGGQAQRVALARAIVREPDAFLLDEPMSDLDAKLKIEMRKELGKIHKKVGSTMLYVTHDQEEALTLSDRIAVMNDGEIEQIGTPQEIFQHPANVFVSQFIGSPTINLLEVSLESKTEEEIAVSHPEIGRLSFRYESNGDSPVSLPDDLVLGFRPRYVELTDEAEPGIAASVVLNEPVGDDVIQYLDALGAEYRALTPIDDAIEEDTDVSMQIQTSGVFLFDRESESLQVYGEKSSETVEISEEPRVTST
jgi:multiple sugar transport system ATP-binding protein